MIGSFAGEFDIQKGCVVKYHYPQDLVYNESILSSYVIPDGVHKNDYDCNVFRYCFYEGIDSLEVIESINISGIAVFLFSFNKLKGSWQAYEDSKESFILKIDKKSGSLFFVRPQSGEGVEVVNKSLKFVIHEKMDFVQVKENFISFRSRKEEVLGINIQSFEQNLEQIFQNLKKVQNLKVRHAYFMNVVKNKKDSQIKRGLLTRSLAICSEKYECLHHFYEIIKNYLDIYSEKPLQLENDPSIEKQILAPMFEQICAEIDKFKTNQFEQYFMLPKNPLLFNNPLYDENTENEKFSQIQTLQPKNLQIKKELFQFPNLFDSSLIELITVFKNNTLKILHSILRGHRIIFLGYDKTVKELVRITCATAKLARPINIFPFLFPYEHLFDLDFLENDFFIAAVTNPIFSSRKEWYDLFCDISTGLITKGNRHQQLEEFQEDRLEAIDNDFMNQVLNKIQEGYDEIQICNIFSEYNQKFLDLAEGNQEDVDLNGEKERSITDAYLKRINIFQKSPLFLNLIRNREIVEQSFKERFPLNFNKYIQILNQSGKRFLSEVELVQMTILIMQIKEEENLNFFLQQFQKNNGIEGIGLGMYSQSDDVAKKCVETIYFLERFPIGKKIVKRLNFMTLYVYQNLKSRFKVNSK